MSYAYTSDSLIAQVQRRGMIPTSSNTLATADFLSFINDEIQTFIVPFLMSVREEFFVTYQDVSVTAGVSAYPIPERAIGSKLRDVQRLSGSTYVPMSRLEPERIARDAIDGSGTPEGYFFRGNNVVLWPTPSSTLSLRLFYFIRPNRVVALTETTTVATSPGSGAVTIAAAPSGFSAGATSYDIIKPTAPGFECRAIDQSATRSSTTLTFSATPTGLVVGDYVALAGETPVPQIPAELHPLLAQRVVVRALQALGAPQSAEAEATAERMRLAAHGLLSPRSEGSARYVVPTSGPGFRRRARWMLP